MDFQKLTKKELEHLMSPSQWSKRLDPDETVLKHVKFVTEASAEAKRNVECSLGMKYGPRKEQYVDLFGGVMLPKESPLFVYVHGGYWQELSRDISSYCVQPLVRAGIRVAVVGYDLAPAVNLETIIEEIKQAAKYLLNWAWKSGSNGVVFGGHSAGAHLCTAILSSDWLSGLEAQYVNLFKGLVLISGIYDLRPLVGTYVNDVLQMDLTRAINMSPLLWLKTTHCNASSLKLKVLIAVASEDSPEFIRQSNELHQLMKDIGISSELFIAPDLDHFNIVEQLSEESYSLTKKIIKWVIN